MTSAQVVETSVTNNSSFQNYPHPDDHTIRISLLCNHYKECVSEFVATLRHINADLIKEAFDPDSSEAALWHESTGPLSRLK